MSITCDRPREEKTSGWRQMTDRVFPPDDESGEGHENEEEDIEEEWSIYIEDQSGEDDGDLD